MNMDAGAWEDDTGQGPTIVAPESTRATQAEATYQKSGQSGVIRLRSSASIDLPVAAIYAIVLFLVFLVFGLFYARRKGVLF